MKLTITQIPNPDGSTRNSGCSAALISSMWLITAGHCFHNTARAPVSGAVPYPTTATLNTVDLTRSAGETRTVTDVVQAGNTDIALAQLSAPVTDVVPIGLSAGPPMTNSILTFAGWGATSDVNPMPSSELSIAKVKVTTVKPTLVDVEGYYPTAHTSACLYDSGGPYYDIESGEPVLVAVESGGPACPHIGPEITARVDSILGWIKSVVPDVTVHS